MKLVRTLALALVLCFCFTVTHAESASDTVIKMTCIVKMPGVVREGLYTGQVVDGVPHGYGVFEATNSEGVNWHYIGEWVNGCMTGNGGQYWDSGQSTVGTYENGDLICGTVRNYSGSYFWADYSLDENGCIKIIDYRANGSVLYDGCVNANTGEYHKGTIYTDDGKVFFTGELGEGFSWNLLYVE